MRHLSPLPVEFKFAGFNFPRYIADLPHRFWAARLTQSNRLEVLRKRNESRKVCGPYITAPAPNHNVGVGFYMDGNGQPGDGAPLLRMEWDERQGVDFGGGDPAYPLIARLTHGRGFLAGFTLGPSMASGLGSTVHETPEDAWGDAYECAYQVALRAAEDAENFNPEEEG
jgi:hypothetical protein